MGLRILQVHQQPQSNPFLSAAAANAKWLAPALREFEIGEATATEAADLLHLHAADAAKVPDSSDRPTLVTTTSLETLPPAPTVALSYRQAQLLPGDVAAVIAPAFDTDAVPAVREPGDHFVTAFDGADEHALAAALRVAANVERPLVVLLDTTVEPSPTCEELLRPAEATGRATVARFCADEFPDALANAAAYLAFGHTAFDMAALTAMACGTPVIALPASPANEVFVHGESGFCATSVEDACRWAERLELLSPTLARQRARALFDARSAAQQYADLYARLLRGERPVFRHPEQPAVNRRDDATEQPGELVASS